MTLWSGRRTCRRWHSQCTNSREGKAPWRPPRIYSPKLSISPKRQTDCTRLWDNSVIRYVAADQYAVVDRKRDDTRFFNWTDVDISIYHPYFYDHSFTIVYYTDSILDLIPRFLILAILKIFLLIHYAIEFHFFVSRNVEAASSLYLKKIYSQFNSLYHYQVFISRCQ